MDFLGSSLIVFAILIAVAVAAISFEPANPLEKWHRLVERYGSHDSPAEAQFTKQAVRFGAGRGSLRPLNPFVSFDVTLDDYGLWLVCRGPDGEDVASAIRVPGTHVKAAGRRGRNYLFDLYAEPPVRISVTGDVGGAILQKSQAAVDPIS